MAYPVAAGAVQFSGTDMRYVPAIYAGKLLIKFD